MSQQGVFGLTLLAILASGCSFKRENARGSFFTLPFLPYTWVTYESLNKENHEKVLGRKEIKVHQGFTSSFMIVKNYDSEGKYLGEYRIRKQESMSISTRRGGTWRRETVVAMGRGTRARATGVYGSNIVETEVYNEKGEFVKDMDGMPSDVPRDFPFRP